MNDTRGKPMLDYDILKAKIQALHETALRVAKTDEGQAFAHGIKVVMDLVIMESGHYEDLPEVKL